MKLLRVGPSSNGGTCLISARAFAAEHAGCVATAVRMDAAGRQIIEVIGRYGQTCKRNDDA